MAKKEKIRVLCLEDDANTLSLIRGALESESPGFVIAEANDRASFEKALDLEKFDLALVDLDVSGMEDVLEAVSTVKKRLPSLPVIVVSGRKSVEIAVKALKSGADDYVIKSAASMARLPKTIMQTLAHPPKERTRLEIESNLLTVVDNSPDGILVVGMEGDILFANKAAGTMLGKSPNELAGQTFGHLITEGQIREIELPHRKDGPGIAGMRSARGTWNGEKCFVVTLRDITGQKESEKRRAEAEELLRMESERARAIADSANDAIIIMGPDGKITFWNPAAQRILGYKPEEAVGRDLHQLIAPELYHSSYKKRMPLFKKTGKGNAVGRTLELEAMHKDGREIPIELSLSSFKTSDGWHAVGFIKDISDRRKATEALQKSEERYRLLVENAHEAIMVLQDGKVKFANWGTNLLGYSQKDVQARPFIEFVHEQDRDLISKRHIQRLKGEEIPARYQFRAVAGNGETRWLEVTAVRIEWEEKPAVIIFLTDITERRRAEQELRESRERYRILLETIQDIILLHDIEGRIKYVNQAGLDFAGFGREEAIGRMVTDFIPPEKLKELETRKKDCKAGNRETRFYETEFRNREGKRIQVEVNTTPILKDGKIEDILVIARDMTWRRQAERKLRENERFMTTIFESIQDGISILNSDLTIRHTNGVMKKWYADNLPLEGKHCYSCYHNADRPCDPCPSLRCMQTGKQEREIVPGLAGSEVEWIELFSYPMKDPATGEVTGVVEFVRDITGLRRADAQRERLMAAIEQAGECVVITDEKANIQYVNPAFERITGYSRKEVAGRNPRILKSGEHDDAFYKDLWATILSGKTWTGRFVNRRKDGSLYNEAATISPVMDSSGKITNYVAVKRDITEHLQLEDQLRQAQKMESVGRLAGGVAHDYNNMLSVIIGTAEMALQDIDPQDPLHADLEEILKAARRSADITKQLLAFARKQTAAPRVLDLNKTIDGFFKMLKRLIGEDIDLVWLPAKELWPVKIDPSQVDQILVNLCVNAKDAISGAGKITIETGTRRFDSEYCEANPEARPGDFVMFAVTDNGCGIDKETAKNIFEPFFTTKEMGKGTGLGLSTVYGIVKQNNGFINLYSEPGQGTTFRIYLPRHMEKTGPARQWASEEIPSGHGETILFVEDEKSILKLGRSILQRLGYNVITAATPDEAIEAARANAGKIDLLMTDVILPEMNGRELAARLEKISPGMKTVFMSGYTADAIAHHGVLDPGINFIQKPFTVKSVAKGVRMALEKK